MKIARYYSQSHVYIYFLRKGHRGQMGFDVQSPCKSLELRIVKIYGRCLH